MISMSSSLVCIMKTLNYFLGLEVTKCNDCSFLSEAENAYYLLSRAGLTDSRITSRPLETNVKLLSMDVLASVRCYSLQAASRQSLCLVLFTYLLIHLLSFELTLMLIGLVIPLIIDPPLDIVSYLELL
jgi:hypothetical protein